MRTILVLTILLTACGGKYSNTTAEATTTPSVINGITVPPEPNPSVNNATVLGVDSNGNGVRDDVERQVATMYGANAAQFDGVLRVAKIEQEYVLINGDTVKAPATIFKAVTSGACILEKFNDDAIAASKAANFIFFTTINTPERMSAYRATTSVPVGQAKPIPANPCQ